MGEFHDVVATRCGDFILNKIRNEDKRFKQIFSTSIIRTGDWDWPRPDYVCFDENLQASYALEFKPPFQTKREYLCGLGQALSYLQKHSYSGLIVPYTADDGFRIAEFINDTLSAKDFENISTSLFAYHTENYDLDILKPITHLRNEQLSISKGSDIKTFWCWWRDLSHYELYDLLYLSFLYAEEEGDIYSNFIYPKFYKKMIDGNTLQWDGTPRKKTGSVSSMKSEKQNYKIPLVQLGLFTRDEGRLTDKGYELLSMGKKYGAGSARFLDALTYLILVDGRHLDLINIVENFQKVANIPAKSSDYAILLEQYLTENGCIGKRKPTAVTTGAKNSYMRDEMKLWNKLGLLSSSSNSYFYAGKGYVFNWERITKILREQ